MKTVTWVDKQGWSHQSLLRDNDPDASAPQGIPQDPPDVNSLDWDAIKRDLHQELLNRGLLNWSDLERLQNSLSAVATTVLKPYLVLLFRQTRKEE